MADRHRSKQINKMNSITSYEATKAVVRRDTEEVQSKGTLTFSRRSSRTIFWITLFPSDQELLEPESHLDDA